MTNEDKERYIDIINRAMGDAHLNTTMTPIQIGMLIAVLMDAYDYYNKE